MSILNKKLITDPKLVIPYLQYLFYDKIPLVCEPHKMYLIGSRGRTPVEDWGKLDGKDWDILIETTHRVMDTYLWYSNYYLEIVCGDKALIDMMRGNNYRGSGLGIEIFPNTPESLKQFLI